MTYQVNLPNGRVVSLPKADKVTAEKIARILGGTVKEV